MDSVHFEPNAFFGSWRRFGPFGAVYEVIGESGENPDGTRLMRIRVLGSGEETDYRLSDLANDPEER